MTMAPDESLSKSDNECSSQRWTEVKLGESQSIRVTNPSFPVPQGLDVLPNFLSEEEASSLLEKLDERKWQWGGFTQKLRIQKYATDSLPPILISLVDRLVSKTNCRPHHVVVEEYPCNLGQIQLDTNRVVTTFESLEGCGEQSLCDCCFVAQVSLIAPAMQHMNRPEERDAECWALTSDDHWTDIKMEPQSLIVKSGEALWNWRSRVSPLLDVRETDRVVMVKFYNLPDASELPASAESKEDESVTMEGERSTYSHSSAPMPPLEDVLTIIVITSPIRSNPSTEMLEKTFETFSCAGDEFAYKCRKVIVCDGCRILEMENGNEKKVSRKHANVKQALRNGIATETQAERYQEFKENLKALCENATRYSPFWNTSVVELQERHGYGFALRHALRHCITTPYVCVIQHDRTFMRPTPVYDTVKTMWNHSKVKYVGMSMRSNLMYYDIFQSKYGKTASDDLKDSGLILRPPELALDASIYGPKGSSCEELNIMSKNAVKGTVMMAEAYRKSSQFIIQQEWAKLNPPEPGKHQLTLTPTLFWYDNTHICETAHYRDFIFHPKYQMVARGGFVEDKLSPNITKSVERLGLADGHARFGCYLLDDHSGTFFTGHMDGGNYLTQLERQKFVKNK